MAMRTEWTGVIAPAPGLKFYVDLIVAKESYAGAAQVKELCACHNKPFSKPSICAVSGKRRQTKEGKNLVGEVPMVKGAEKEPDAYVPVDAPTLNAIEAAVNSDTIECEAYIDRADLTYEAVSDPYFVRAKKGLAGALEGVAGLYRLLESEDKLLIGVWGNRGRQHRVAFYAANGRLMMAKLRYAQELKEPDDEVLAPGREEVADAIVSTMDTVFSTALPDNFNLAETEDDGVVRKAAAIRSALAGELQATPTPEAAPKSAVPDLLAQLTAAQQTTGKPARKTTKPKEKVKA